MSLKDYGSCAHGECAGCNEVEPARAEAPQGETPRERADRWLPIDVAATDDIREHQRIDRFEAQSNARNLAQHIERLEAHLLREIGNRRDLAEDLGRRLKALEERYDVLAKWNGALAKMAEGPAAPREQSGHATHEFLPGPLMPALCGYVTAGGIMCCIAADDPVHTGAKP